MAHSTDARFFAFVTAYTALVRALVLSDSLNSAIYQQTVADGRDWMVSLGADPVAIAAYDDLMRSVLNALE